jgi:hypothetical protein
MVNTNFKYPIGKCESLQCYLKKEHEKDKELLGYSFHNSIMVDTETNTVRERTEKVPACLKCYLYEKPLMEDRMAEEKIRYPAIIPYKWFYFYNEEDEKKYPDNWERRYEKLLAKEKVWKKYRGKKDLNTIVKTPEWQKWLTDYKDCLSWDEMPPIKLKRI